MDLHTFWGSLRHWYSTKNQATLIWTAVLLLEMLVLAILHHVWRDDPKKLTLWRRLALIPLLTGILHLFIYVCPNWDHTGVFIGIYLIAFISIVPMLLAKRKTGYRVFSVITGLLTVIFSVLFTAMSPSVTFLTNKSYTESFRAAVRELDRYYVLKDWKGVDFDALEEKYLPRIEAAEKADDPAAFVDAVGDFTLELHDGHVSWGHSSEIDMSRSQYRQHEYGLGLIPLSSGEVIAVCTADEVQKKGITEGTVITKWNGKPVAQAVKEDTRESGSPVKENDDLLRTVNLSGVGGETVTVTFLDSTGSEQTVTLDDLGEKHSIRETLDLLAYGGDPDEDVDNFSTKMLDEKCGYLMMFAERTGNPVQELLGYLRGDDKWTREMLREKLRELKAQGMESLVIDLRENGGGMHEVGMALVSLLTKDDWYGQGLAVYRDGKYECVSDHRITGDGEFADLKVAVLANYSCESAGDGTAYYLSRLPNVTVMGMTDPVGCGQETGGNIMLTDDLVQILYPRGLCLNEDGEPNIDTRADRVSRNPVEIRIPLDMDAAMRIFRDRKDYELEYALQYLKEQ